jgi:hypothetical protein
MAGLRPGSEHRDQPEQISKHSSGVIQTSVSLDGARHHRSILDSKAYDVRSGGRILSHRVRRVNLDALADERREALGLGCGECT